MGDHAHAGEWRRKPPSLAEQTQGLGLFEQQDATRVGIEKAERSADRKPLLVAQLVKIALEIAEERGVNGVTVGDLRDRAAVAGIIPRTDEGRALSYLGAVMRRAGLVNTGPRVRSTLEVTHGNLNTVWVAPRYAGGGRDG